MLDKLAAIEAKYSQIEARLAAPETYDDPAAVARLNKEQKELSPWWKPIEAIWPPGSAWLRHRR